VVNGDLEIQLRSKTLLSAIRTAVDERQLSEFLSDTEGKKEHKLPGWKHYHAIVGGDLSARLLFVKILEAEKKLLRKIYDEKISAADLVSQRLREHHVSPPMGGKPVSLGSIAAIFLIAGDPQINLHEFEKASIYRYCYNGALLQGLAPKPQKEVLLKLIGAWVLQADGDSAYLAAIAAASLGVKEGLVTAEKILKNRDSQPVKRAHAMLVMAKFADASQLTLIESLLEDHSVCAVIPRSENVELRDVALCSLILLKKQDPRHFGFRFMQLSALKIYDVKSLRFPRKTDREQTFLSWNLFLEQGKLKAKYAQQLKEFIADSEGKKECNLPGWKQFQNVAGNDGDARKLFAAIFTAEVGILKSTYVDKKITLAIFRQRMVQLDRILRLRTLPTVEDTKLGSLCAVLLLAGDPQMELEVIDHDKIIRFLRQPIFKKALSNGSQQAILHKLVAKWIVRPEGRTALQVFSVSTSLGMKEGLIPARKIVNDRSQTVFSRATCILAIARLGDVSDVALLESLLNDQTELLHSRVPGSINLEIRDVALVTLLHLTKQDHKKYGFDSLQLDRRSFFKYSSMQFESETRREQALTAWKTFRKQQKLKKDKG